MVFEKCPLLCLFFGFANWTKMVHAVVSQLKTEQKTQKRPWNHCFSAGICYFAQLMPLGGANKTNWAHWCFLEQKMVLFEKPTGDVWKPVFFCRGFRFCSSFVNPFFLLLARCCLMGLLLASYLLLLLNNSSFYVLVVVSCCFFGFLGFIFCLFA